MDLETKNNNNSSDSFELTYYKWIADKPLLLGSVIFLVNMVVLLIFTVSSFVNLQLVRGKITTVRLDKQKHIYLTVKLEGSNKIYYQTYQNRFYDPQADFLKLNDEVKFYTFKSPDKEHPALSRWNSDPGFWYYPIFNINSTAGILQVFYYYLYNYFAFFMLFCFSIVLLMYNGFYIVVKASWLVKAPSIVLMAVIAWLIL